MELENLNDSKKDLNDSKKDFDGLGYDQNERNLMYAQKDRDIEYRRTKLWNQPASYELRTRHDKSRQKRKTFLRRLDKGSCQENISKKKKIRLERDKGDEPKKSQTKSKNRKIISVFSIFILLLFIPLLFSENSYANIEVEMPYTGLTDFEYSTNQNLTWEISGLTSYRTSFDLSIDGISIDSGYFSSNDHHYCFPIPDLALGDHYVKFTVGSGKEQTKSNVNIKIKNIEPIVKCLTHNTEFESNSPESLEFKIEDMSTNSSTIEVSLFDRYLNKNISKENWDWNSNEIFQYPISNIDTGIYELNVTIFDGLGMETSLLKRFNVVENLAPILFKSESTCVQVEQGEVFTGYFNAIDYNNFGENNSYLITLDENNIEPIETGIWDGINNNFDFSIETETLSIGYHSISIVVMDSLGKFSQSYIDFDLRISKDPIVTIISDNVFTSDYSNPNLRFEVSDFELFRNATYKIEIKGKGVISGYLSDFLYHHDELNMKIISSYQKMPSNIIGEIDIQKYLWTGENEIILTINDGKGGVTTKNFVVTLEKSVSQPIDDFAILFLIRNPSTIFILYLVLILFGQLGSYIISKQLKFHRF